MRFHSSRAAVVAAAAAILLAVTGPARSAPVVIDSFTNLSSPNPLVGIDSGTNFGFDLTYGGTASFGAPTGTLFNSRAMSGGGSQGSGTPATFSLTFTTSTASGGSIDWGMSKTFVTAPPASAETYSSLSWFNDNASGSDLTAGGNDTLRISRSAASLSGTFGAQGFVHVHLFDPVGDPIGSEYVVSPTAWFSAGNLDIPLSYYSGTNTALLQNVGSVLIQSAYAVDTTLGDDVGAAMTSSVALTEVSLVPEPTQMAFVAGAGAALGLWRMRKLRRDGCESDVTTG